MPISLDIVSKFQDLGVKNAESGMAGLAKTAKGFGIAAGAVFAAAGAAAVGFGIASLKAAAESEAVTRGLENAVKNAGAFGSSAAEIDKVTEAFDKASTKLAELSGIDDEVLNGIKTQWLAVPAIAGMGIQGINDLAVTAADVAAGTGRDIESVANVFAKAFENPASALAKLEKAGVFVTDSQKAMYDSMVANGDAAGAQTYLIDALGTAYAGAAEAAANPFDRLKVIFENLMETVGGALMPAIEKIVPIFSEFINGLSADPEFQAFLEGLGEAFGSLMTGLQPLLPVLLGLITSLLPPIMSLIEALAPVVIELVAAFAPLIQKVFGILPGLIDQLLPIFLMLMDSVIMPLIPIVMALIDAFMPLIDALLPPLMSLMQTLMPVIVSVANAFLPIVQLIMPMLIAALGVVMPIIQLFADLLMGPLKIGIDLISGLFQILTGDFEGAGKTFQSVFEQMRSFGRIVVNDIIGIFEGMVNSVISGLNLLIAPLNSLLDGIATATGGAVSLHIPTIPKVAIPRLADGGIVMPSPGGSYVNVAEAGKAEAIIPLDRLNGMGKGGNSYTINISALNADAKTGEMIVTAIKRFERTSGSVFVSA
jgi:phage-related protein